MTEANLELLKIFYEVAKQQSITKASESLFISQPAVSQSIKKLEENLGCTLFNRSNKGINLTTEGKCFYEYVKLALQTIKNGQDELANFKKLEKGEIKIGVSTTLTKLVLLNAIKQFHKDYPKIKINIINGLTSDILTQLEQGKLDLALYNDDIKNNQLDTTIIKEGHHCFVYNEDFYNFENQIEISQLANYPLVLQNKQSNTRKIFDKIADKYFTEKISYMEVVSQELVSVFSECGFGIGFVIEEVLKKEKNNKLKKVPLKKDLPPFYITLAKSSFFSPTFATKEFIKYIKKFN